MSLKKYLPEGIARALSSADAEIVKRITELRVRKDRPLIAVIKNTSYFLGENGDIYDAPCAHCVTVDARAFDKLFMELCSYSLHSHTEELKKGYITLENGARVGVASSAVYEKDRLISVKDVTSLNIRIPNTVKGCADSVLNFLYVNSFPSIIVAGKPNSGKTTLLRELARELSGGFNGRYRKVCIIDERYELTGRGASASWINCDVLSGFGKAQGIELATRTLSPELIVCDEIAASSEAQAVSYAFSSGIRFAVSVHIGSKEELFKKKIIRRLLSTGAFSSALLIVNVVLVLSALSTVISVGILIAAGG